MSAGRSTSRKYRDGRLGQTRVAIDWTQNIASALPPAVKAEATYLKATYVRGEGHTRCGRAPYNRLQPSVLVRACRDDGKVDGTGSVDISGSLDRTLRVQVSSSTAGKTGKTIGHRRLAGAHRWWLPLYFGPGTVT